MYKDNITKNMSLSQKCTHRMVQPEKGRKNYEISGTKVVKNITMIVQKSSEILFCVN